jgi:drug/metabolite transporter (DMT)-like permease
MGFRILKERRMSRIFIVSIALLVGGIVLIAFGVSASNSLNSDISRFFTGSPTDKAIWMLVGGAAASIAGALGLLLGKRASG